MDALRPGRIFWGVFPGRRGDGKTRPMLVMTRRTDLIRTGRVFAIVCSTDFTEPLLPIEVILPSQEDGLICTRLKRPTVAVCDWTTPYTVADIEETSGMVPAAILQDICRKAGIAYPAER